MDSWEDINLSKYNKVFVTGCDRSQEWMLDWFLENYKRWNNFPIVFGNFGISESMLTKIKRQKLFCAVINLTELKEKGWFKKPKAMLNCPSKQTVWLDTDCEILGDISKIFDRLEPHKLNMISDIPWSKRTKDVWYNSGVVGFIDKPKILYDWAKQVKEKPKIGDQEVLHSMLDPIGKLTYVNELPNYFNVTRIQHIDKTVPKKPLIYHWTGMKGKEIIKKRMNGHKVFLF